MIKYSLILLGAYFLYYAGNIVYDLFLKKEKIIQTDTTEEFSIVDFAQTETPPPTQIEIEDVEDINTPKSFLRKEFESAKEVSEDVKPEIEDLRRRFEAEQDMDDFNADDIQENEDKNNPFEEAENKEFRSINKEETKIKKTDWKTLLSLSETSVQMVANYEGQKVYHSFL
ncbi:hypothetical protein [Chryseobacterium sp.]|uniref:hypothetical protein n=1 Tax=Chryseobacterium sp. TaxID=1871047 RepID=UPI0025BD941F|nr:hypothetical protein [Chryseobacterium sp.]